MSGIVIGSMVLGMVGCSSNEQPKEQVYIIKHVDSQGNETKEQVTKQEYDKQVKEAKEAHIEPRPVQPRRGVAGFAERGI